MSTNYVCPGESLLYVNSGSAISSGDVVVIGTVVGIAKGDIAATSGTGVVDISGVWTVTKKTGTAWTQGAAIYWDADPGEATTTATDNTYMGIAYEAAASADATGKVVLGR